MGLVAVTTFALVIWIVLWAIGFGRAGDSFILFVPIIVLIGAAFGPVVNKVKENSRKG